eukprot:750977-Amphidinium_carterae.1
MDNIMLRKELLTNETNNRQKVVKKLLRAAHCQEHATEAWSFTANATKIFRGQDLMQLLSSVQRSSQELRHSLHQQQHRRNWSPLLRLRPLYPRPWLQQTLGIM